MNVAFIETDRLILRKPVITDSESIFYKYAQDSEVTKYLTWKPHGNIEETKNFICSCISNFEKGNFFVWCITKKDDEELIGMIHLILDNHKAEFGYVLMKNEWSNGYISESLKRIIQFAFTNEAIHRVCGICDVDNKASAKVMEKVGLTKEGILRKYIIHPNISSLPRDVFVYSIIK